MTSQTPFNEKTYLCLDFKGFFGGPYRPRFGSVQAKFNLRQRSIPHPQNYRAELQREPVTSNAQKSIADNKCIVIHFSS